MKYYILSFLSLIIVSPLLAKDWPQYHGVNSDRTTDEVIKNTDWESKKPKKLWSAMTPTGFSSFILADGAAYTNISEEIDGIPSEVCISFDANTGETNWKANLDLWRVDNGGGNAGTRDNKGGDGPRTTPSYSEGKVYAYTSDMRLVCLSAENGKELWSVEVIKSHKGRNIRWENAAAPLIEDDAVIVQGGGAGQSFLAFDKKTGKLKWKSGDYLMTHATPIATDINQQRQILFFTQKGMVSINPKNGKELWMHKFPTRYQRQPLQWLMAISFTLLLVMALDLQQSKSVTTTAPKSCGFWKAINQSPTTGALHSSKMVTSMECLVLRSMEMVHLNASNLKREK